jgi:hypothetical protein
VANYSKFSPDSQGRNEVIMKTIIASTTRLILSYSKFGLMVFSLSLINTALKSNDNFYYLNSGSQFLKLGGVYIQEKNNIRNRRLVNKFIKTKYGKILV